MALEYATDLRIFDATTAEDADPLRLIDAVASWGAVSDPLQEGEHVARRGHSANVSAVYAGGEDLAGWRLVLSHPDESDVGVTWTVTCTVTTGAGTHFALRLDRTRDGALIPLTSVPAPPGVLRDLLERDDLFAMDATFDSWARTTW